MADDAGADDDDEEWRFSVDEVGDDTGDGDEGNTLDDEGDEWGTAGGEDGTATAFGGADAENDAGEGGGNVAGSVNIEVPVESDTPALESAVFVAAGALLILLVFASIVTPLTPQTIGAIALSVAAVTGIVYAIYVRF